MTEHEKPRLYRCKGTDEVEVMSRTVFAELVLCIKEVRHHDEERVALFKLSDLAQLHIIRMEQLGIKLDMRLLIYNKAQSTSAS